MSGTLTTWINQGDLNSFITSVLRGVALEVTTKIGSVAHVPLENLVKNQREL